MTDSKNDRRTFPRLPGSRVRWLRAITTYSAQNLTLVDISDGGALIETERRIKPGEREPLVLSAHQDLKVAAHVLRVEIVRLAPKMLYRSAIQFLEPISVASLLRLNGGNELPSLERTAREQALAPLRERFDFLVRQLRRAHDIKVCSAASLTPSAEAVYFKISQDDVTDRRFLQVSFTPGVPPTAAEFQVVKELARLAAELGVDDLSPALNAP